MKTHSTHADNTSSGRLLGLSQVSPGVRLLPSVQSAPDEGRENYSENVADPANVAPRLSGDTIRFLSALPLPFRRCLSVAGAARNNPGHLIAPWVQRAFHVSH